MTLSIDEIINLNTFTSFHFSFLINIFFWYYCRFDGVAQMYFIQHFGVVGK